ncbi:helix-turn-helix domain-containing protein [Acidithiobacillus sp. M4-SHS-6]|uniref:helix-turn-helix domain-containing protein n=1 Tax=Acidithiobacillus sp. M4-SHS-6 TaxID=3383024 RepID=UPI0039BE598A
MNDQPRGMPPARTSQPAKGSYSARARTLDLQDAADFLQISKEELRRRAKDGRIRAAKPGKCWAFLEEDLVAYFRSLYPENQVAIQQKEEKCSTNAGKRGGLILLHPTASALDDLLAQLKKTRRRNCMTTSKAKHGDKSR